MSQTTFNSITPSPTETHTCIFLVFSSTSGFRGDGILAVSFGLVDQSEVDAGPLLLLVGAALAAGLQKKKDHH